MTIPLGFPRVTYLTDMSHTPGSFYRKPLYPYLFSSPTQVMLDQDSIYFSFSFYINFSIIPSLSFLQSLISHLLCSSLALVELLLHLPLLFFISHIALLKASLALPHSFSHSNSAEATPQHYTA